MAKKVIITVKTIAIAGVAFLALILGLILLVFSGVYNVSAAKPQSEMVGKLLSRIMVQSVRHHARDVNVPPGIDLNDRALAGQVGGAYGLACRSCHAAPGMKSDPWVYLYPAAADLTRVDVVGKWSDKELFWIIKNGVAHTGMIGLGPTHDDEKIWSVAAFVRQLPTMSPSDYKTAADEYAASKKEKE